MVKPVCVCVCGLICKLRIYTPIQEIFIDYLCISCYGDNR